MVMTVIIEAVVFVDSYVSVNGDVSCSCVGVQECEASSIDIYHCPNCFKSHGPLQCTSYKWVP